MEQQQIRELFAQVKPVRKKWLFLSKQENPTAVIAFTDGFSVKQHTANSGHTHDYVDCTDLETGEEVRLKLHGDLKAQLEACDGEKAITPNCVFKLDYTGCEENPDGPDFQMYEVRRASLPSA